MDEQKTNKDGDNPPGIKMVLDRKAWLVQQAQQARTPDAREHLMRKANEIRR